MHTLRIYWLKRKLVFILDYSLLASATIMMTIDSTWIAAMKEKEPVEELLKVYKNYEHLFAEEGANELPLHQLWGLSIKLMEGKTLLY